MGLALRLAAWEPVPTAGDFLDGAAFFEFRKHFEQRSRIGLFEMQRLDNLVGGGGIAPNLQKTQYVIRTEM
jgi:hypothetical protein